MVKLLLTKPPVLVPPCDGELLLLYIAATTQVVSASLVVEREEEGHAFMVQRPVSSSARYCLTQKPATPKSRNSYTPYSSPRGSYATTSSHTL